MHFERLNKLASSSGLAAQKLLLQMLQEMHDRTVAAMAADMDTSE